MNQLTNSIWHEFPLDKLNLIRASVPHSTTVEGLVNTDSLTTSTALALAIGLALALAWPWPWPWPGPALALAWPGPGPVPGYNVGRQSDVPLTGQVVLRGRTQALSPDP